mgnify:CR=1 FL=1
MASTRDEPVPEPEMWTARLRDFVHECIESTAREEASRVREAARLFAYGAEAGMGGGADGIDLAVIDAMLACGAAESAVLAMLSPRTVFMVSRGQGNSCLATVIVGESGDEVISEGPTVALALLSAYSAAQLSALDDAGEAPGIGFTDRMPRLH